VDPAAVAAFYQAKGYAVREGVRVPGLSGNEHRVPLLAEGPLGSLAVFFGDFGGVDGPEMGGARKAARDIGATPVLAADEFSNNDRQVAAKLGVVLLDGTMMHEDAPSRPPAAAWPGLQINAPRRRGEPDAHPWPASGRTDGAAAGPAAADLDIDDLLAETRPKAAPEPAEPPLPMPAPSPTAAAAAEPAPSDTLWRKPRAASAAPESPSKPASREAQPKFAWLGGEARPSPAAPGVADADAPGYDGVVAARAAMPAQGDAPRLGEEAELLPTMEELERRKRRDRLQRRLFWLLFVFTFLYLGYLFWTNRLF
jgi:hypothetical protein